MNYEPATGWKKRKPMDKILLKQAQRIIDHIIENKPEDVDWLFVERYRELLNKHLERSNEKKNKKNSI